MSTKVSLSCLPRGGRKARTDADIAFPGDFLHLHIPEKGILYVSIVIFMHKYIYPFFFGLCV